MARPFGSKTRPPIIADDKYAENFVKKKGELIDKGRNMAVMKMDEKDRLYLLAMFESFKNSVDQIVPEGEAPSVTNKYRYTPKQMWENIKKYMEVTIQCGQPLTISGLALFNGLDTLVMRTGDIKSMPKEYGFLFECRRFVEMYNEFAAHRKLNPAGPIFILKNFGWKDKFEIEASAASGALTEEERAEMQRRVAVIGEERTLALGDGGPTQETTT